jgi:hypothetical protein
MCCICFANYIDSVKFFVLVCKFIIVLFCNTYNRQLSNQYITLSIYYVRINDNGCNYKTKIGITLLYSTVNKQTLRIQSNDSNICRLAGGNMYGPGRGRALSLIHIPESGAGDDDAAPLPVGAMTPACSVPDLRRSMDDDVEQGINLLIAGSPIDDSLVADDTLLDYESDESNIQKHSVVPSESTSTAMDTESTSSADTATGSSISSNFTVLDAMFHQCRASRLSGFRYTLVSISSDNTFGEKIVSPTVPIGTFEDHNGLKNTFHGSRLLRGNVTVNQSISLSFDPTNLVCLSCTEEHIVIGTKPVTICFADQNFVASVPFTNGNCVSVVRVENSTLIELLDIAREIFGNIKVPEGSVFLFGSASYLGRCGTSLYASEWTSLFAGVSSSWRGVHVCPLVPLILTECPGSIMREICELSV